MSFFNMFLSYGLLYLCFVQFATSQSTDVPCTFPSGTPGICTTDINSCSLNDLQKESIIFPCDSDITNYFCCPKKQSISSRKCSEYAESIAISIGSGNKLFSYNGEIVDFVEEFPFMALLGYNSSTEMTWGCGGTLISEQFILTAAHCLNYVRVKVSHVHLGFLNRSNRNVATLQAFQVVNTFKYPNRTGRYRYHDIALLQLDRPVQFTEAVFPACLHEDTYIEGRTVTAVGWGITEDVILSEELRKVHLTLLSHQNCTLKLSTDKKLPDGLLEENMFCAGTNDRDTCKGDSGGPALIRNKSGFMNSVVGVTSFGTECVVGKGITPGVYTRVAYYIPWIESIVWPKQ